MLIEMRSRSQITLPVEIVKKLGIREGDKFEVIERDGGVFLCPVVVYPKAKMEEIIGILKEHRSNPTKAYESLEDMFKALDIDLEDDHVEAGTNQSI